jgi:hypothetical protein
VSNIFHDGGRRKKERHTRKKYANEWEGGGNFLRERGRQSDG